VNAPTPQESGSPRVDSASSLPGVSRVEEAVGALRGPRQQQGGWISGLVAGLAAAGAALGVAELVAAPFSSVSSPVVAVGNVVVDNVPNAVKEFAIATFGQNDKIALIFGTTIFLFIFGAVLGMLTTKRRIAAPVGAGVFASSVRSQR
jgi:hypothetical protein